MINREYVAFHDLIFPIKIQEYTYTIEMDSVFEPDHGVSLPPYKGEGTEPKFNGYLYKNYWIEFEKRKAGFFEEIEYNQRYTPQKKEVNEYLEDIKKNFIHIQRSIKQFSYPEDLVTYCLKIGIIESTRKAEDVFYKDTLYEFWYELRKSIPILIEYIDHKLQSSKPIRIQEDIKEKNSLESPNNFPEETIHRESNDDSKYLTTSEVAALFKVSTKTIHNWRKEGKINGTKFARKWLYEKSYIQEILIEHHVK